MKQFKKIIAAILAVMMILSSVPLGIFATEESKSVVAKIGDTGYETLAAAVKAAETGQTVQITKAGTYKIPNLPKNITIKGTVSDVVFDCVGTGNIASVPNGATFENVTMNFGTGNYHGFQGAGAISMKNCTLNGLFFSYGEMNFDGCMFNAPGEEYSMWTYAGDVTYTNCVFNGAGKFINVYNEGNKPVGLWKITATGCKFNSTKTNKAAFNVKETCGATALHYEVYINDCTCNENFPAPSESDTLTVINGLVQVDDRKPDTAGIMVTVDDDLKYSNCGEAIVILADKSVEYCTFAEAIEKADKGGNYTGCTIKLLKDIDVVIVSGTSNKAAYCIDGGNFTIDGCGHTITGRVNGSGNGGYIFNVRGDVVAKNLKIRRGACEAGEGSKVHMKGAFNVASNVKLTLENCDVDVVNPLTDNDTWGCAAIVAGATSTVVVKSGTYKGGSANDVYAIDVGANTKFTFENGTTNGIKLTNNAANFVISGGTHTAIYAESGKNVACKGVFGGTFSVDPSAYVAPGYKAMDNGNGTWSVVSTAVVEDVEASDVELKDKDGNPIQVSDEDKQAVQELTEQLVEDLNKGNSGATKETAEALENIKQGEAKDDAEKVVVVNDDGTTEEKSVEIKKGETSLEDVAKAITGKEDVVKSDISTHISITFDSASVKVDESAGQKYSVSGVYWDVKPIATVDGKTFVIPNELITEPITFLLKLNSTFTEGETVGIYHDGEFYEMGKVEKDENGDLYVKVTADSFSVYGAERLEYITENTAVVNQTQKIAYNVGDGEGEYATAAEALDAALNDVGMNDTICLLCDVAYETSYAQVWGVDITFDLGGHALSSKGTQTFVMVNADVTIKNGKIFNEYSSQKEYPHGITIDDDSTVIVEKDVDIEIKTKNDKFYAIGGDRTSKMGTVILASESAVYHGAINVENATVSGGHFYGAFSTSGTAVISGGTFDGEVNLNGTESEISGGTFVQKVSVGQYSTISGGAFASTVTVEKNGTVTGGAFAAAVTVTTNASISGGKFMVKTTEAKLADDKCYRGTTDADGYYEVVAVGASVDTVNGNYHRFETFAEAYTARKNNSSVITLFADAEYELDPAKKDQIKVVSDSDEVFTASAPDGFEVVETENVYTLKLKTPEVTADLNLDRPYDGQDTVLTVVTDVVTDTYALTYQWYKNGATIDGETADTYTVPAPLSNNDKYTVRIAYNGYTAESAPETVIHLVPAALEWETAPAGISGLTYNAADQALITAGVLKTVGVMGDVEILYSLDGVNYSKEIPTGKNAGEYTVYYKVNGGANHDDIEADSLPVTIDKKKVTITAKDSEKVCGNDDPAFSADVEGVCGSEELAYTLSRVAGADVGEYAINVTPTAGNAVNANYEITVVAGKFTIIKAVAKIGNVCYKSLAEAIAAVPATGAETTIVMIADETIIGNAGVTVAAGQNIVLDLNGKTIKNVVTENTHSQVINNKGTLTIKDSGTNGCITNSVAEGVSVGDPAGGKNWTTNIIENNGNLTVISGSLINAQSGSACYAVDNNSADGFEISFEFKGGLLKSGYTPVRLAATNDKGVTFKMTAGTIEGEYGIVMNCNDVTAPKYDVTISGGTVKASSYAFYTSAAGNVTDTSETKIDINGGTFGDGTVPEGEKLISVDKFTNFISGGTFTEKPNESLFAPEYAPVQKDDGSWGVDGCVATITRNGVTYNYNTFAEAIEAAQNDDIVTLLKSASGNGITINKNLTIDLNGKTYTVNGNPTGSTGTKTQAFQFLKGNNITIKNGKIDTVESAEVALLIQNYANLTLTNVELDGTNLVEKRAGRVPYTLSNNNGDIVLDGETKITAAENGVAYDLYDWASAGYNGITLTIGQNVTITGKVEVGGNRAVLNIKVEAPESKLPAAPANYDWVLKDGKYVLTPAVAQIGDKYYATLEKAINAAQAGETVTLIADCSGNGITINKNLTIDLNGKTYTVNGNPTGSTGTKTQAFQLLKGNNITIKNGKIDTVKEVKVALLIQNYANLTLTNVELDGTNLVEERAGRVPYTLSNNNGDIVLDGETKITAAENGVAYDLYDWATGGYGGITMKIGENVTITGKVEVDGDRAVLDIKVEAPESKLPAAPANYDWVVKDGKYVLTPAVARIGDKYYATLEKAINAAQSGDTVTLLKDASGNGIALLENNPKTITIDLGGYTYTVNGDLVGSNGTKSQAFHFEKGNNVTIKNGTLDSTNARMFMQNYANLELDGVTLDGTGLQGSGRYVLSNNSGTVTINNSKIKAKSGDFALDTCKYGSYDAPSVTLTGTTEITGDVELSGGKLTVPTGTTVTMSGSFVEADGYAKGDVSIASGTYASEVKLEYSNGEFHPVKNNDGTWTVAEGAAVAKIGDVYYTSVKAAVDAAQTGDEILLVADATISSKIEVKADRVTINGQGHKITGSGTSGFVVTGDNVTFKNLTIDGCTGLSYKATIYFTKQGDGSTMTVDNCTINGNRCIVVGDNMTGNGQLVINKSDLTGVYPFNIQTGKIEIKVTDSGLHGWTSYGSDVTSATFTNVDFSQGGSDYHMVRAYADTTFDKCDFGEIENGEGISLGNAQGVHFVIKDSVYGPDGNKVAITPENIADILPPDEHDVLKESLVVVGEEKLTTVTEGVYNDDPAGYLADGYYAALEDDGKYHVYKIVAKVNGTPYKSYEEAYDAVEDNGTIELLADHFASIVLGRGITVVGLTDENGKPATKVAAFTGDFEDVTLKNIELTNTLTSVNLYGTTFENCLFSASGSDVNTGSGVRYGYAEAGKTTLFKDCVFDTTKYGAHFDGNGGAVVFDGCTIVGFNTFAANVKVTYNDCTFTSTEKNPYSVCQTWGNMAITGETTIGESWKPSEGGYIGTADKAAVLELGDAITFENGDIYDYIQEQDGTTIIGTATDDSGKFTGGTLFGGDENIADVQAHIADDMALVPVEGHENVYTLAPAVAVVNDGIRYSTLAEAVAAAKTGDTVKLLKNTSGSGIKIDKNLTIDFNGKTYTVGKPGVGSTNTKTIGFQILEGNTVEFKNGTINMPEANKSQVNDENGNPIKMLIQNYANLKLTNMVLDGTNINRLDKSGNEITGARYVVSTNAGEVIIDGTEIIANDKDIAFDVYDNPGYTADSTVKVMGNSVINGNVELSGGNLIIPEDTEVTMTGSFVKADGYNKGDVSIASGTFSEAVLFEYCAKNFEPKANGDGTYGVKEFTGNVITTAEELVLFAKMVNAGEWNRGDVKLGADIDMAGIEFQPIGTVAHKFVNNFDGQGYKISNLTVNATANYAGLFGYTSGGTIENVKLVNANIQSTGEYVGAIAGYGICETIKNCEVSGSTVSGLAQVGGIVGYINCSDVTECTVSGCTISAVAVGGNDGDRAGGIVGKAQCDGGKFTINKNIVKDTTITADSLHSGCKAGGIVSQMMLGNFAYSVSDNKLTNVTTKTGNDATLVPIGEVRTGCSDENLIYKIRRNNWSDQPDTTTVGGYEIINYFKNIALIENGSETDYFTTLNEALKLTTGDLELKLLKNINAGGLDIGCNSVLDLNGKTLTFDEDVTVNSDVKIIDTAATKGGVICLKPINVNGKLDVSELGYGTTGLIGGQPGSLAIKATGEVVLMNAFATKTAPWIDANSSTFFAGTVDGATLTNGGIAYVRVNGRWEVPNAVAQIERKVGNATYYDTFATLQDAIDNAQADETVQMMADVDVTSQVTVGKKITLDMNGKTLTYTGTTMLNSGVIGVKRGGDLTVTGNGIIKSGANAYAAIAVTIKDESETGALAKLTVENGTFEGYYYGIVGNGNRDNTEIVINGGKITGGLDVNDGSAIYHPQNGTLTVNGGELIGYNTAIELRAGTLNITGGTFTAENPTFSAAPNGNGTTVTGAAIAVSQHNTNKNISVTISGGTFNGVYALYEDDLQDGVIDGISIVDISGGTFNGKLKSDDCKGFVTGGTFEEPVLLDYCNEDFHPIEKDGKYTVAAGKAIAVIERGDKLLYFATLQEAVDAVANGETIKLLDDFASAGVSVASGKNFTLDFNNKTVTFNMPGAGSTNTKTIGFQLLKGSTIVFKDGTIKCSDENKDAVNNTETGEKPIKMLIQNYANLMLDGMTIDGTNLAHNEGAAGYVMSVNCGNVVINNTTITAADGDYALDTCNYDTYAIPEVTLNGTTALTGKVSLSGGKLKVPTGTTVKVNGSFVKADGYAKGNVSIASGTYSESVADEYCASGFVPKKISETEYTVTGEHTHSHGGKYSIDPATMDGRVERATRHYVCTECGYDVTEFITEKETYTSLVVFTTVDNNDGSINPSSTDYVARGRFRVDDDVIVFAPEIEGLYFSYWTINDENGKEVSTNVSHVVKVNIPSGMMLFAHYVTSEDQVKPKETLITMESVMKGRNAADTKNAVKVKYSYSAAPDYKVTGVYVYYTTNEADAHNKENVINKAKVEFNAPNYEYGEKTVGTHTLTIPVSTGKEETSIYTVAVLRLENSAGEVTYIVSDVNTVSYNTAV